MVRIHYFAVMVTIMKFSQFFYKSSVEELTKAFTNEEKNAIDFFITFLWPKM